MKRRYRLDEKEFSEINITPFTDVILVLLIIFMITSPFLISGSFNVKLPESTTSESEVNESSEVFLTADKQVYVNNQLVTLEELPVYMQIEFSKNRNKDVVVKADKSVTHGDFIKMLDALKKSGAGKLLIATTKVDEKDLKTK